MEPNPGPSSYHVMSWNAQGFNHLVQALQLGWFSDFDVIAIQEPNLSRDLHVELAGMCERRGFRLYARPAEEGTDSLGRRVARGGLPTLVRHGLEWATKHVKETSSASRLGWALVYSQCASQTVGLS